MFPNVIPGDRIEPVQSLLIIYNDTGAVTHVTKGNIHTEVTYSSILHLLCTFICILVPYNLHSVGVPYTHQNQTLTSTFHIKWRSLIQERNFFETTTTLVKCEKF